MCALVFLCALSSRSEVRIFKSRRLPLCESMRAEICTSGRTSRLTGRLDVAKTSIPPPDSLFSGDFLGDSEGFGWYASRNFAIKTDLCDSEAAEALLLLELALPQLGALFGMVPCGYGERRFSMVVASSRDALHDAMHDDSMNVFELGGVTQEGFSAAYLYRSSPYQTRYILLHELVHLYQYCLSGNTRSSYGFFVEGVADFFSSHVYSAKAKSLTVNVLDRAPIHNHLKKGLDEWRSNGRPSFESLYRTESPSRGISVLLCAFLQSTPSMERAWRLYAKEMCLRPAEDPASRSHAAMEKCYGPLSGLDGAFSLWAGGLEPSFDLLSRDFDQDGDSFVSGSPASHARPALLALPPLGMRRGLFACDWPAGDDQVQGPGSLYSIRVKWERPDDEAGFASVSFKDAGKDLLTLSISNSPRHSVAFLAVDGKRHERMSYRRFHTALESGVTFSFSKKGECISLDVAAGGASFGVDMRGVPIEDFMRSRPVVCASRPSISFTPSIPAADNAATAVNSRFPSATDAGVAACEKPQSRGVAIENWEILGPFPLPGGKFAPYDPPSHREMVAGKRHARLDDGTIVRWTKATANRTPLEPAPIINVSRALSRQGNSSVAYARTVLHSEKGGKYNLRLGVADAFEAYLDGRKVYGEFKKREWTGGSVSVPLSLRKGENELVLKLTHSAGLWLLSGELEALRDNGDLVD